MIYTSANILSNSTDLLKSLTTITWVSGKCDTLCVDCTDNKVELRKWKSFSGTYLSYFLPVHCCYSTFQLSMIVFTFVGL